MINDKVIKIFQEIANFYNLSNNGFKAKAFNKALNGIKSFDKDLSKVGDLTEIPGIGSSIAEEIKIIIETGKSERLTKLKKDVDVVPGSVFELTALQGIGPVGANKLYKEFGIKSINDLDNKIKNGQIKDIELIEKFNFMKKSHERIPRYLAEEAGNEVINYIKSLCENISFAGSIRRKKDLVRDIDIVLSTNDPDKVIKKIGKKFKVIYGGDKKLRIEYQINLGESIIQKEGDIIIVKPEEFGCAINYLTGSWEFNIGIRSLAKKKGYTLNEFRLLNLKTNEEEKIETEEDLFKKLKIPYVLPELRMFTSDVGKDFKEIITEMPKIDLHIHSNNSDGRLSIDELAKDAIKKGYELIGISDHTKKLPLGIPENKLKQYVKQIHKHKDVYSSLEVEVDKDSKLAYDIESLKQLDYVIIAIHHSIGKDTVKRYINAITQLKGIPKIIAHPTTRLFPTRSVPEDDWDKLYKICAKTNTILEINCQPDRLDLPVEMIRTAKQFGCKFIISSDSHGDLMSLEDGYYLVRQARLERKDLVMNKQDVLNFLKGDLK